MFEKFFQPKSIAVVGASRTPGKVGYDVVANLLSNSFSGTIYPVNPKADTVQGLDCYGDVTDIPGEVDLAVVAIPAKIVPDIIDQCAKKDIDSVVVISAGFKETGQKGKELEQELARRCQKHGIRCIGPNCLGIISPPQNMNASFGGSMPPAGNIAFISQSGALGTAFMDVAAGEEVGISRFISFGNKADVDETDLLEALGEDDETNVILAYLESVKDGPKFREVARRVTRKKPIVVLKSGRSSAGAKAASSHTGSLAGSDSAYDAAFHQSGVLRAATVQEFIEWARALSSQHPPRGPRTAVVTNAGGPGIITTDAIDASHLQMAQMSDETYANLRDQMPEAASISNPLDVLGDARADRYETALRRVCSDPEVDSLLVLLTPQTSTEPDKTAQVIIDVARGTSKPIAACFMGSKSVESGRRILDRSEVPSFRNPEDAVKTLDGMYHYAQLRDKDTAEAERFELDAEAVQKVIDEARADGLESLGERRARRILQACDIPVPRSELATSADEAARMAADIGGPVVLKISSEDILHKSDAGGVKVGLEGDEEVRSGFEGIIDGARDYDPDADIDGVLVQQMAPEGREVIVGMNRDPQFGPLIMFGLGGIYVELLKDVSFRTCPVSRRDAEEMVDEIETAELLKGFRGDEPADRGALVDCILRIGQLSVQFPALTECDLNPLMVYPEGDGLIAVDARFALSKK
ncbi:MAG: acetate--CoA ligase family protein [Planctomycetota bacterium]